MNNEKESYEIEFEKYSSNYDISDPNIKLKINHMYRVQKIAREIAMRIYLPKKDVKLASFLGLYHDIGRFDQLKNYGTYSDSESFDHGDYGADILEKDGYIKRILPGYSDDIYKTLVYAVRYHNKYILPKDYLDLKEGYLCKIIRDADKIDIFKAVSEEYVESVFFEFEEKEAFISEEVKEVFYRNETVPRSLVKTKADSLAVMLAFVFDINYSISKEILLRSGNVEKFVNSFVNVKSIKETKTSRDIRSMYNYVIDYLSDY